MDKNELESMGISLLLDDVVKKPPQVAAANTGGDKGVRDIDKVISSIENGRKVSVGSDDDEECDDDEYGEDSGEARVEVYGEFPSVGDDQFIWPLLVANDQMLFNMELGLTAFQFRFSADTGKLMAGSVVSVVPMLIVFILLRRRIIENMALTGLKG